MKPQDIIKTIAELDGFEVKQTDFKTYSLFQNGKQMLNEHGNGTFDEIEYAWQCKWIPSYLTSRDAIVPVIEKLINDKQFSSNPADYPTWMFSGRLLRILKIQVWDNGTPVRHIPHDLAWLIIKATPSQLSEALLRATGKWKD